MPTSPIWSDLISPEYLGEQRLLHLHGYGGRGSKWAPVVNELSNTLILSGLRCDTILDYGCGQGSLGVALREFGQEVQDYDPAVKRFRNMPAPAHLVTCTDVLEHVEPEKIGAVLDHLRELTKTCLFTVISLVETAKTLSDGRQAHILLKPESWWGERMIEHHLLWDGETYPNAKPAKQFVASWRPI